MSMVKLLVGLIYMTNIWCDYLDICIYILYIICIYSIIYVHIAYVLHKISRSLCDFLDYIWSYWSPPNFATYLYLLVHAKQG